MKQVASRYLLPLEMLLGSLAIVIGFAGVYGSGVLFANLRDTDQGGVWFSGFTLSGLWTLNIAATEWIIGRTWSLKRVGLWASFRTWGSLALMTAFGVASAYLLMVAHIVISLTFICPLCAGFTAWCYIENYKIKDVLDESINTKSNLIFHR